MNGNNSDKNTLSEVQSFLDRAVDKPCCRQRITNKHCLSIGFGEKKFHGKKRCVDTFYGEWEFGSYAAAWRVVRERIVLCGSEDLIDSVSELDSKLNDIELGCFISISVLSEMDIRINFDCGIYIDFLSVSTDDDEIFHIFGPDDLYIEYSPCEGWMIGKASAQSC